jgi:hypothetical protein
MGWWWEVAGIHVLLSVTLWRMALCHLLQVPKAVVKKIDTLESVFPHPAWGTGNVSLSFSPLWLHCSRSRNNPLAVCWKSIPFLIKKKKKKRTVTDTTRPEKDLHWLSDPSKPGEFPCLYSDDIGSSEDLRPWDLKRGCHIWVVDVSVLGEVAITRTNQEVLLRWHIENGAL